MSITVAVPMTMQDDANQLAMVLGEGPADALTYSRVFAKDDAGNVYAWANFLASQLVQPFDAVLERPAWDDPEEGEGYTVNMTGAERAQEALVFWMPATDPEKQTPPPQASPTALTAIAGMDGLEALAAMGLTRVEEKEEHPEVFT